jgi:hypothetical protein
MNWQQQDAIRAYGHERELLDCLAALHEARNVAATDVQDAALRVAIDWVNERIVEAQREVSVALARIEQAYPDTAAVIFDEIQDALDKRTNVR